MEACFDRVGNVARCVQDAVRELASEHCESRFEMMLTNGSIVCDPSYKLPDSFRLARPNTSCAQTLYEAEEGDLDGIELKMADLLSISGRIRWWLRVAERRGTPGRIAFTLTRHSTTFRDILNQVIE